MFKKAVKKTTEQLKLIGFNYKWSLYSDKQLSKIVTYVISSTVCLLVLEHCQYKAEIFLLIGQGPVVEAIVVLLITQGEGGWQGIQFGSNVHFGRIKVSSAPQNRAVAWPEQLRKR